MSITVFFPTTTRWDDAHNWVAERRLPVTPIKVLSPFSGWAISRYYKEIDKDDSTDSPRMIYHRQSVTLRRKR